MTSVFNFTKDHILEDERVLLRPLQKDDIDNLLHFSLNQPDLWIYSLQPVSGRKNFEKYIDTAISARENEKEYSFTVFDKLNNAYAGSTRFYDINLPYQTLQLGYTWYGKKFQGTGLNKHCKYLLLSFAFEQMNMERVEFRANALNARSIAAMKSIGCKVDGILRNNMPEASGKRRDSIVLSILKNEWFEEVKEKLKASL